VLGEAEADVTQQAALAGKRVMTGSSPRRDQLLRSAKVCGLAGLALTAVSVLCWLLSRASGGGEVPPWLLSSVYWWCLSLVSLIGFWLAVAGLVLGIAYYLSARRLGQPAPWAQFLVLVSVVALLAAGGSIWLLGQPPYFLAASLPPSHAELDALGPGETVRAYLTSQNLSVQYRLSDAGGRALRRAAHSGVDVSLLPGVSDVRITPLRAGTEPNDAAHRAFGVSYISHAGDAIGDPAGERFVVARLVRSPGGPWRISYLGSGI
jgi:hypothetical protein